MKLHTWLTLALLLPALAACTKDESLEIPADTVSLNVMDEDHGKTLIGPTDIYMTRDQNIVSQDYWLFDCGQVLDIGHVEENGPDFQTASNIAGVDNYKGYIAVAKTACRAFYSGNHAVAISEGYYRLWADEWIKESKKVVGMQFQFAKLAPERKALPEWNSPLGTLDQAQGRTTLTLEFAAADIEVQPDTASMYKILATKTNAGKKSTTWDLSIDASAAPIDAARYPILVRQGKFYSRTWLIVQ